MSSVEKLLYSDMFDQWEQLNQIEFDMLQGVEVVEEYSGKFNNKYEEHGVYRAPESEVIRWI